MSRDINSIINSAKEKLDELVSVKGLDDPEVQELSKEIDKYLIEYYSTYN